MTALLIILLALIVAGGILLAYSLCVIAGESDKAQGEIMRKIEEEK